MTLATPAQRAAHERLSTLVEWMGGRMTPLKVEAADITIELWLEDGALGESLAQAQWFQDGITRKDLTSIQRLAALASRNLALARSVASSSWFGDVVSDDEGLLLERLGADRPSPSLLAGEPEYAGALTEDLVRYFLYAQNYLRSGDLGDLDEIIFNAAWFADGLSPLEMAFVVSVSGYSPENLPLYRDLGRERYAATRTTSLPLAGEVSLYLFQNTPIPDAAYILDRMEATARALEALLDVPFPTSDIILVIGDGAAVDYPVYRAGHFGTHMHLNRLVGQVDSIAHEVAHYYFHEETRWFVEGAAELVELFVDDAVDVSVYAPREDAPPHHALSCLADNNAQNIRHFFLLQHERGRQAGDSCTYSLGERLMVHLYESIGAEALGSALRSWYLEQDPLPTRFTRRTVRLIDTVSTPNPEHVIFDALFEGIPEDARDRFEHLYLEMHGGIGGGPDDGIPDDFSDGATTASIIAAGETTTGTLEHSFDFDYFRFEAVGGQTYQLDFQHRTRTSSVAIYDIPRPSQYNGNSFYERFGTVLARVSPVSMELGRHRLWIAPRSGVFYLAVQNFGGAPGPYTLSISPVEE